MTFIWFFFYKPFNQERLPSAQYRIDPPGHEIAATGAHFLSPQAHFLSQLDLFLSHFALFLSWGAGHSVSWGCYFNALGRYHHVVTMAGHYKSRYYRLIQGKHLATHRHVCTFLNKIFRAIICKFFLVYIVILAIFWVTLSCKHMWESVRVIWMVLACTTYQHFVYHPS